MKVAFGKHLIAIDVQFRYDVNVCGQGKLVDSFAKKKYLFTADKKLCFSCASSTLITHTVNI